MTEVFLLYACALLLSWPLGLYLKGVYQDIPHPVDRIFGPFEALLYRLFGVDAGLEMGWRTYARAMLQLHVVLALIVFLILVGQHLLPLNPDGVAGMSWDLALHTTASFITNTNQQHYSGQAQLSYVAQLFAIVSLQFITPAAGMAALVAILRGLFARTGEARRTNAGEPSVGNFYADLIRTLVRVLLPLALLLGVLLASQGVPATYRGAVVITPLDPSAGQTEQRIPLGPVAPMVAIKQLATNGGGWYGPNSAVPLENPTPISNFLQMLAIVLLPIALVVMAGYLTGRHRLAVSILVVMTILSLGLTLLNIWSENQPNAAFAGLAAPGPNMEGKEVRIGATVTALWGSLTTQTSNGSVNGMHDSFNPLGGASMLMDMFMNAAYGGVGVGLINYLLFLLLAVFLGSLMVGRSPELYGRALDAREIKLVSFVLILQPVMTLGLAALTVAVPALAQNSNPGYHGLSQVLYEYTSAFANNGSGFEGLGDNTPWWNISCAVALILGRFIPILAPLAIASHLAGKRTAPITAGSLDVATPTFALLTLGIILLFALLSYFPALTLGPFAEQLTITR